MHVAVIGHVTSDELRRNLTDTEAASGFGNRFLYCMVRRSQRLPRGGNLPQHAAAALGERVSDALTRASKIQTLHRTSDAEILWETIYNSIDDDVDGLFGAVTARAEAQMLRLSVVYALLDGTAEINVAHVTAAKAAWDFCEMSAAYIFGDSSGDYVIDRLFKALKDAGDEGLTGADMHALFARHVSADRLDRARRHLEDRGLITVGREDTGGRPTIRAWYCARSEKANKGDDLHG